MLASNVSPSPLIFYPESQSEHWTQNCLNNKGKKKHWCFCILGTSDLLLIILWLDKCCMREYISSSPPLVFSGDVRTLTPVDRGIMTRLELVREQRHRQGPVFQQTVCGPRSPLNYHPNYNCITLHTCSRSQKMVNKYSHIISTNEWKQRANRPTGDIDVLPVGPNLVRTHPSLMWVNNKKGSFFFIFWSRIINQCDILRRSSRSIKIATSAWDLNVCRWALDEQKSSSLLPPLPSMFCFPPFSLDGA